MLSNGKDVNIEVKMLIDYTTNLIKSNKLKEVALANTFAGICKSVENLDSAKSSSELLAKLNTIKTFLDMICYNRDKLNESQELLKQIQSDLSTQSPDAVAAKIQNYNDIWNSSVNNILANYISVENFLNNPVTSYNLATTQMYQTLEDTVQEVKINNIPEDTKENSPEETSNVSTSATSDNTNCQSNGSLKKNYKFKKTKKQEIKMEENIEIEKPLHDNTTLLISETKGKVFLPYKLSDLENNMKKSHNKYKNIEDLIKDKYILPISRYKFPFISRFKEAFYLMKEKEKASIIDSLSLATELATNSLPNPAVISACRNIDELDIYLDYLSNNKTEQFNIFKVKYEIPLATK